MSNTDQINVKAHLLSLPKLFVLVLQLLLQSVYNNWKSHVAVRGGGGGGKGAPDISYRVDVCLNYVASIQAVLFSSVLLLAGNRAYSQTQDIHRLNNHRSHQCLQQAAPNYIADIGGSAPLPPPPPLLTAVSSLHNTAYHVVSVSDKP